MRRRKHLHILSGQTIKSALHPLRPYIAATIGCAIVAWVLFNLSQTAESGSLAYLWIRTLAEAFTWIAASAAIAQIVLFTIYLLQDARRTAHEIDDPPSRR